MTATTLRLPDDLDERLTAHCASIGAVKNRVVVLALPYLDDEPARRLVLTPPEQDDPLAEEPVGARRLVLDLHEREFDPDEISAATDLDPVTVAAVLEGE